MISAPTFEVKIYCGLAVGKEGYHSVGEALGLCQAYCDTVGLCVTLTPTKYVYKGGAEDGIIVGLINYPRFPATPDVIVGHALDLARILKSALGQKRVSVATPERTFLIGELDDAD